MKVKVGDVFAVQLPDSNYAFGRVMQEYGFQVFNYTNNKAQVENINYRDVKFTVTAHKSVFNDAKVSKVDHVPFDNEEESWPPDTYIYSMLTRKYSLYSRGTITPSTQEECQKLEHTAVWELNHIIDQFTGRHDLRQIAIDSREKYSRPIHL